MADRTPLTQRPIWVNWKLEPKGDKLGKMPYSPTTGDRAQSNNPATWGTLEAARGAVNGNGQIGCEFGIKSYDNYVEWCNDEEENPTPLTPLPREALQGLDPTGAVLVDFDHCRNAETGEIEPWAVDKVRALNSLTEISQSGEGLHVLCWGTKPGDRCEVTRPPGSTHPEAEIGIYAHGRFVALTMKWLPGFPTELQEREAEVHALYHELFPPKKKTAKSATETKKATTASEVNSTDSAVLRKARRRPGFKLLEQGDISEYDGDDSRADAAYCFHLAYVGAKHDQIERLWRASKLDREKLNRDDYRERTISGAIQLAADLRLSGLDVQPDGFKLTDLGNAERLVARHGEDVRYVAGLGWLAWDGKRWAPSAEHLVNQYAAQTIRALYEIDVQNNWERQKLIQHALESEGGHAIRQMITLARSQPGVPALPSDFDADPWLLNVTNGTVDLRTGKLQPHRRKDLLTKLAAVDFNPEATAPRWLSFLEEVMSGDQEMTGYVRRAVGSALCGKVHDHALFILWGDGANGKGTLTRALRRMLGDYGCAASADLLLVSQHGTTHPTTVMDLWGARFVAVQEVDDTKQLAEALVKRLTGGDPLRARRMRQDSIEFWPSHTLFLETNYRPAIRGTDYGIWRRIHLLPFTVRFEEEDQDGQLDEKLAAEASGILRWAVDGCLEWQRDGLRPPQAARLARDRYREDMEAFRDFEQHCIESGGQVRASDLYAVYQKWATARDRPVLPQNKFGSELSARGYFSVHRRDGNWWMGIHPKPAVA
jgi:putative DNA primase/helicase